MIEGDNSSRQELSLFLVDHFLGEAQSAVDGESVHNSAVLIDSPSHKSVIECLQNEAMKC